MGKKIGIRATRLYRIWLAMKNRCSNSRNLRYKDYGGRGITVCDEWRNDFKAFYDWAMSNGYSEELTIDRINNDGNYEPLNCRWVTIATQNRNSRHCKMIEFRGERKCLIEWCETFGLSRACVSNRLYQYGWSIEKTFLTPPRKNRQRLFDQYCGI